MWLISEVENVESAVQVIPLIIQDQFHTIQNLQESLFHKPVSGQKLFFCCFLQETGSRLLSLCTHMRRVNLKVDIL